MNVTVEKGTHFFMRTRGVVEVTKDEKGTFYIKGRMYRQGQCSVAISDDEMREAMKSAGWLPEQVEFMVGLFYTVRQGWVAPISPAVSSVLGRDPISFEQFARENADAWK